MERGDNPYLSQPEVFLAKVVAVHSATGTIDVALDGTPYQGGFYRNVPVLSWSYATQTGHAYLPSNIKLTAPIADASGVYDQPVPSGEQDVWAVIAHLNARTQRPVCMGFLSPLASQVHTKDAGYEVKLHESGVFTVISPDGQVTTGLPDGSTVVIGASTTPVDMAKQNPSWNPPTTTSAYSIALNIKGNVSITVAGSATINAPEVYLATAEGSGAAVARVGDSVSVSTTTGEGTITSGSAKTFSG